MFNYQNFARLYGELTQIDESLFRVLYDDNVEFVDPITRHKGLNAVYEYVAKISQVATTCSFQIDEFCELLHNKAGYTHTVTWTMVLVLKNRDSRIVVDGLSQLKVVHNKITYQRDYYDLGEMVYEQIPVLGWLIRKIKRKLSS